MKMLSKQASQFTALAAAAILIASLTGCEVEKDSPTSESAATGSAQPVPEVQMVDSIAAKLPDEIKDAGKLKIVMTTSSPPAHFTTDDGLEGLDRDIGQLIGDVFGVETEFIGVPIDQVVPGFQSGKYDLVVSQFTPSAERAKVLDFVNYAQSATSLAILSDTQDLTIDTMCGKRIASQKGSIQATERVPEYSEKCTKEGKDEIQSKTFRDTTEALLALQSSRVDGVLADGPVNGYAAKKSDGKIVIAGSQPGEPVAVGSVKGDGLDKPVKAALEELSDDGAYEFVFKNWGMGDSMIDDFAINKIQSD